MRARSLGCYGYDNGGTRTIDRLASQGVLYENCFTCSNASDPALTSMMSGMLTRSHGILHHSFEVNAKELKTFNDKEVRLVQEVLKENGYGTYGLDFLARWHMRGYDYYPNIKIDRTKRKKRLNQLSRLFGAVGQKAFFKKIQRSKVVRRLVGGFDSYLNDEEITEKAVEIISQNTDPYFLFVHYWGVHKSMSASLDDRSIDSYDRAIEQVDKYIEQIADAAGEDTVMVILGDHGESLGEHDIWFDHHGLYDPTLHIPLILSGGSVPAGKRVNGLVSITDVFSTILSMAEIDYLGKTDSIDLSKCFDEEKVPIRDYIFAEENYYQDKVCLRTGQFKFIKTVGRDICEMCNVRHGESIELYDLVKDPGESRNIASSEHSTVAEFEEQLKELIGS
ncbi:MAG: sulfatase [Mariniphaga sp.]|nr:sulfatase [Mariniphaga sp.]